MKADLNTLDALEIPSEVFTVTSAQDGQHVVLGLRDRSGDTAAIVLDSNGIITLCELLRTGYLSSLAGVPFFKGVARPVLEDSSSSLKN